MEKGKAKLRRTLHYYAACLFTAKTKTKFVSNERFWTRWAITDSTQRSQKDLPLTLTKNGSNNYEKMSSAFIVADDSEFTLSEQTSSDSNIQWMEPLKNPRFRA